MMRLLNMIKRKKPSAPGQYLSWDEYKRRLIEMRVLYLIEKLTKDNLNYNFKDVDRLTKNELARFNLKGV